MKKVSKRRSEGMNEVIPASLSIKAKKLGSQSGVILDEEEKAASE